MFIEMKLSLMSILSLTLSVSVAARSVSVCAGRSVTSSVAVRPSSVAPSSSPPPPVPPPGAWWCRRCEVENREIGREISKCEKDKKENNLVCLPLREG